MFESSITNFTHVVQEHRTWGYMLLFFGMVLEGEVFLIISAMLARLGAFDFAEVISVAFAGVMVGDVFWYWVGMILARFDGRIKIIAFAERTVHLFFPNFQRKPFFSILLSKFIYGINHATLVFSGATRLKFSLFFHAELLSSMVWVAIYAVAGYLFGNAAIAVTRKASHFALLAVVFVVGFMLLEKWLTNYYEQHEVRERENENRNA